MKKRATALLLIMLMVVSLMPALGAGALAAEKAVDITPTTSNPEESVTIAVGDTLTINVTNGSSREAYDFTATLNKSGIAEIQGNAMVNIASQGIGTFTVKGLTDGTVDITISNGTNSYSRKGTIHLTVGDGGSAPVDPPAGNTVDITPDPTTAPEKSISIAVGDTLTINVTNGSSSTYNFTATSGDSSIAEIQGDATISITGKAIGQFTVKGLTDGTVDITIKNDGSHPRTGIIHLTVGDGGSAPVDPPSGDSINITPTTDNPEESITISVGGTYTINVTNGGSSTYDFSATLSKEGVAQIQPSSVHLEAKATGTFTVTGVADGTVDINISNNSSYGDSYSRKATVHVTVGTGGSEEPPTPVTETLYVEVTSLTADGEYILGAVKDDGNVYAIKKGSSSVSSVTLPVTAASGGNPAYIETTDEGVAWKYTADGYFTNGSSNPYMYPSSSNGIMTYSSGRAISFIEGKLSFETSNDGTFYITCNEGTFSTSNVAANAASFRLFMKTDEIPGLISVTGVTLDKATMALTVGGTGTLTATVAPEDAANKNVTWSSSNETVATVNDGTVTALKAGTAVITVKTVDGEWTATCTVTVTAPQEIESSVIELMKLKNNSSVWLIQIEAEAGKGFTYKGTVMVWSSRYEAYVIAVEGATKPEPVAADFAAAGDAAAAVEYPAADDANGSKKVDMADVQYIYNLYSGKYETLEAAGDMTKVLGADINGDGVIDSKDATPILTALRGAQA